MIKENNSWSYATDIANEIKKESKRTERDKNPTIISLAQPHIYAPTCVFTKKVKMCVLTNGLQIVIF